MFAISDGKFLTQKVVSLGLGLHNRTGMKSPIELLYKLGHCISYDQVNLIETAQAELVQNYKSQSLQLPLIPCTPESKVSTIFWWDNLDRNIETTSGEGTIHNTPGIAFQEISESSYSRPEMTDIPKSGRRSISIKDSLEVPYSKISSKVNPPLFIGPIQQLDESNSDRITTILPMLWKTLSISL